MHVIALVFGVIWAAIGLVFGARNMWDWLVKGQSQSAGRWPLVYPRWQWAVVWACVLAVGLVLAVWGA